MKRRSKLGSGSPDDDRVDFWIDKPQRIYWLISTAALCLAANAGLMLLARSPVKCGQRLRESWIERNVVRAQAALTEIEEFERDEPVIGNSLHG